MVVNKKLEVGLDFSFGETKRFSTDIPLRGWIRFSGISSWNILNTTPDRSLQIRYRYTLNAVHYSEWMGISQSISNPFDIPVFSDCLIEFEATRIGVDVNQTVHFSDLTIEGLFEQSRFDKLSFENTVFHEISYDDVRWNKIWINLLHKIYFEGIIPKFIDKNLGVNDEIEDEDYIIYWKTVCYYYALIIELGLRKIQGVRDDENDIFNFLEQKSFLNCNSINLTDLQYIYDNSISEIRKRGTYAISAENTDTVDGELLRYICKKECGEFLFEYLPRYLSGWTLDINSPNFNTSTGRVQLNKMPHITQDVQNLSDYELIIPQRVSLEEDYGKADFILENSDNLLTESGDTLVFYFDEPRKVILITGDDGVSEDLLLLEQFNDESNYLTESNFDILLESNSITNVNLGNASGVMKSMCLNSKLSYELTMYVNFSISNSRYFTVFVKTYDFDDNILSVFHTDYSTAGQEAVIVDNALTNREDVFHFVKCNLLSFDSDSVSPDQSINYLGQGKDIILQENTRRIEVFIVNTGGNNENLRLWDIKFTPLSIPNEGVYIDSYNKAVIVVENNNDSVSFSELEQNISKYLLPYGSVLHLEDLNQTDDIFSYILLENGDNLVSEDSTRLYLQNN